MPSIEILPDFLINKIAAGEVIERPASVVKELIENALDAGATRIKTEIKKSGKGLIKISDNGRGMSKEDALNCIKRHATSKLKKEEDLYHINTMGFRGEALSSIASVSVMTIMTSLKDGVGTRLELHGGELKSTGECAIRGTTIEVKDIFYNTPARRKFLKSDTTEMYHITDTITQTALSYPETGFILQSEKKELLNLPVASGYSERIAAIFGAQYLNGLKQLSGESSEFKIEGYVSKEGNYRGSGSHQYLFINKRPVRDKGIRYAVYQGYKSLLSNSQHPVFFIYIETDPSRVDFNVHPAKREVRLFDRNSYFDILTYAVKDAISEVYTPAIEGNAGSTLQEKWRGFNETAPERVKSNYPEYPPATESEKETTAQTLEEPFAFSYTPKRSFIRIGDVFAAYTEGDGLYIIDHHASHERVMYEKLNKKDQLKPYSLLFPQQVTVPPKEFTLLWHLIDEIREMGIDMDQFGENTFIIRGLPIELDKADMNAILSDIAHGLIDKRVSSPVENVKDMIAQRIACHSSVRGKVRLEDEELDRLLKDLDCTEDPHHCPHGRPTRIHYSIKELRKMFKRT